VEIGSEKSKKNKRKIGGSRARARLLTVAERRIKSAARGGADVGPAGPGSVRSGQISFFFFYFLISFITFVFLAPNEFKLISKFSKNQHNILK
jgi:hypothetical protein